MQKQIVYLPNAVFAQDLTDKELAVFALLTARAEQQGNGKWIAALPYSALAEGTGQSFSTAIRSVRSLERRKWITHIRGKRLHPNQYLLALNVAGKEVFPFPVAAIGTVRGARLRILAYLCSLAASGTDLPPTPEISAALHLHPLTVSKHLVALRKEGTSGYVPRQVAKLLEKECISCERQSENQAKGNRQNDT